MSAGKNNVGPVLRAGEVADAAIEAVYEDNPDKEINVEDHHAYIRVEMDRECIIKQQTMENYLGRPFRMQELEAVLGSFAGQIETTEDHVRFYLTKDV